MSFVSFILDFFGSDDSPKMPYTGKIDPNSVESLVRARHEIEEGESKGSREVKAALDKWGFTSVDQAQKAFEAITLVLHKRPNFDFDCLETGINIQLEEVADKYQLPDSYQKPVHGITLAKFARISAQLEAGPAPRNTIAARCALTEEQLREVQETWERRMGPNADAVAGNILRSNFTMLMALARREVEKTAGAS